MPVPVSWDVAAAAERYRAGSTLRQLGAEFGVAPGSIRVQLVKAGVLMRPARLPLGRPDVSTEVIVRLRDQEHLTWPAIAEQVGMSTPGTFSRYQRAQAPGKPTQSKALYPDRTRPRPWRKILLDGLAEHSAISVRLTVGHHLGRTPTRAELNAGRRAAHRLVADDLATVLRVKPLDAGSGSANVILVQPGIAVEDELLAQVASGAVAEQDGSAAAENDLTDAVKAIGEVVRDGVEDPDTEAVRRLTVAIDTALEELAESRRRLTT